LGYDRIAAGVGANLRYPSQNCLVIDIGTAIKYDLVSAENAFEGGIISPGRRMRFNALHTFTKKLPLLDTVEIPELIGHSTESCMKSGVMKGITAEINGIIDEYLKKLKLTVLICGGDAPYFETKIKYPTFAAPNLVLEGLNRILQYNVTEI
jgi:type III pantothenate kinase